MPAAVFELNGQTVSVNDVDPHCTLLDWLRASGRTGTKEGCAEGECGACAVAFLSRDVEGRPIFMPVNSCLVALADVHGRALVSVEGVSPPGVALHPVQQALVEAGGSQCGYCTPGFVMSLFCEYYRPGRGAYDPEAISGNLCRCTGYRPIVAAAQSLGTPAPTDPWLLRLAAGPGPLRAKENATADGSINRIQGSSPSARARFFRAQSREDLGQILLGHPDAVLMAGGTDLMVYANQRGTRYPVLVSVAALGELQQFGVGPSPHGGTEIVIGAALPLAHLERLLEHGPLGAELELLRQLLPLFSSRLIRNRATLGGNLATASPIGDSPPVLLALAAELTLGSATGVRRVPLAEFFLGYRKTLLAPGEWIQSVHLPRPAPGLQRFYKVSKRVLDDISTVAAAFALDLRPPSTRGGTPSVERLRAAYGGIAPTPLRATMLEELAAGQPWNEATLATLCDAARALGTPLSDQRGSAAYRRAMIEKLLQRFYAETTGTGAQP
jgi:xanthine dehydrogenase small subunit